MLTCKEISKLVSDSLDRKLPVRQRIGVRFHLMMCSMCRAYEKQTHLLRKMMHSYARLKDGNTASEHLSEQARQRIKKALSDNEE